ncbi:protein THYLAKOID FORMATION1, chloroplastic-like isoform X2 [Phoenix dactylifera]|uniref:Protein THYLAKOID FORMATION1, chloroplastic-like isoform X2 n=1 Tax=Phoenix dactylifera TaxID=42345 RepID=A0A8B8J934_PHODC|nr:protein THYLAKOID FORMATION1, chloroplastic-like isoform X2 [Phoenix dactylifera]
MAAISSVSFASLRQASSGRRPTPSASGSFATPAFRGPRLTPPKLRSRMVVRCVAATSVGFVTVFEQLMEGYPSNDDRDAIFRAYIQALKEDPEQYRCDAQKLEEWARAQNANSLADFSSREGEVEDILKNISERAQGKGNFSYSRFFAIGLFRLLEQANATEPTILEKLCAALNIDKQSVDRDLTVYRNLLSKFVQAKDLLKEYVDREKKKREERVESQKANEATTKCVGGFHCARHQQVNVLTCSKA